MFWGGIASPFPPMNMQLSSLSLVSFTSSFMMSNMSSGVSLWLLGCSCGICCGACWVDLWMVEVAPSWDVVVVVVWAWW